MNFDRIVRKDHQHSTKPGLASRAPFGIRRGTAHLDCEISRDCGVCPHVNTDYRQGLRKKFDQEYKILAKAVGAETRTLPPVPSPKPLGYRSHFKLAVRAQRAESDSKFKIGLFKPGTHQVVEIDSCPLHTPALQRLIRDAREFLELSPIIPYDESSRTGDLRYLCARANHRTGELLVTFVTRSDIRGSLNRLTSKLRSHGHKIRSAHMNINPDHHNAIYDRKTIHLSGQPRLRERLFDLDFEISPTSFFQVNPWQAENIYRRLGDIVGEPKKASRAWDHYCGTGQISLVLARLGYKTVGFEENPNAVADATENATRNGLKDRVNFVCGRLEDCPLEDHIQPNLIVVNPSRRGLAPSVTTKLATSLAARGRLIYISCDVHSLRRDLDVLQQSNLQVRQIESFDMFAQTEKLEWLVVLTKQEPAVAR